MALTWAQFRDTLRRTLLKDSVANPDTGEYRFSDEEIRDCFWFALDTFCAHTACATATSYTPATGTTFSLPENIYTGDEVWATIIVYYVKSQQPVYLDPVRFTPGLKPTSTGYYLNPNTVVNLTETIIPDNDTLYLQYYGIYNRPYADTDVLDTPHWAQAALTYLTAAHVLAGAAYKAANIRQWNTKNDSGSPIQNPLEVEMRLFFRRYEEEISRFSVQQRINHFRN